MVQIFFIFSFFNFSFNTFTTKLFGNKKWKNTTEIKGRAMRKKIDLAVDSMLTPFAKSNKLLNIDPERFRSDALDIVPSADNFNEFSGALIELLRKGQDKGLIKSFTKGLTKTSSVKPAPPAPIANVTPKADRRVATAEDF